MESGLFTLSHLYARAYPSTKIPVLNSCVSWKDICEVRLVWLLFSLCRLGNGKSTRVVLCYLGPRHLTFWFNIEHAFANGCQTAHVTLSCKNCADSIWIVIFSVWNYHLRSTKSTMVTDLSNLFIYIYIIYGILVVQKKWFPVVSLQRQKSCKDIVYSIYNCFSTTDPHQVTAVSSVKSLEVKKQDPGKLKTKRKKGVRWKLKAKRSLPSPLPRSLSSSFFVRLKLLLDLLQCLSQSGATSNDFFGPSDSPGLFSGIAKWIEIEVEKCEGLIVPQCIRQSLQAAHVKTQGTWESAFRGRKIGASTPTSPIWFCQRLRLVRVVLYCNALAKACRQQTCIQSGKIMPSKKAKPWPQYPYHQSHFHQGRGW